MGRRTDSWVLLFALVVLCPTWLGAHDFWIEPSSFHPPVDGLIHIRLRVGEHFKGHPFPRDPLHIRRFLLAGPKGMVPVIGLSGSEPAGYVRVPGSGLHVIVYGSHPRFTNLTAESFEKYLQEEGLERISERRALAGRSGEVVREAFSRNAKSLLSVGPFDPAGKDRKLGLKLELVAGRNPDLLSPGDELPVCVFYDGEPLEGLLVAALSQRKLVSKIGSRSDDQGCVLFRLPHDGVWLIKTVHMVPAPEGSQAEWESFWSSLTFEIPE